MNERIRGTLVVVVTIALAVGAWWMLSRREEAPPDTAVVDSAAVAHHYLPDLEAAEGWLNGPPLTADSLAGRIVVLAFWSATDPRSIRSLPEIEAWHRAYQRYGVRVIAVHSPEFAMSSDPVYASRLPERFGLTVPLALDPALKITNELATTDGLPRYLVADPGGRVVLDAGPGQEGEVDAAIRQALVREDPDLDLPSSAGRSDTSPPPAPRVVYLGANRAAGGPLATAVPGRAQMFTTQFRFQEEGAAYVPYPVGKWTQHADGLTAERGGPSNFVAIRSANGTVSAMLGPGKRLPSKVWILEGSGWLSRKESGADVRFDERGAAFVEVREPRIYAITRAQKPHMLRLSPEDPGVTFYSFVFEGVK